MELFWLVHCNKQTTVGLLSENYVSYSKNLAETIKQETIYDQQIIRG